MASPSSSIEIYTGGYFQTNGYAIPLGDSSHDILLVDAPEGVTEWIASRGWVVKAVLFTHLHYDHVIDAAALRAAHPEAHFCAHSQPDADLTLETVLKESIGWPFDLGDFSMDETLADQLESSLGAVEIAGETIGLLHVPGHSPDSLAFYRMASSELFAGDALFNGSIGRTDFPHGDSETLSSSIRTRIYPLPDNTTVYPGHGPSTTVGDEKASNPYVRP